eukprot:g31181.t1
MSLQCSGHQRSRSRRLRVTASLAEHVVGVTADTQGDHPKKDGWLPKAEYEALKREERRRDLGKGGKGYKGEEKGKNGFSRGKGFKGHEADADHRSGRLPGMFQRISIEG